MHIRGERPTERQPVGPGLLLDDAPGMRLSVLGRVQPGDQRRPHDAGLHFDLAPLRVEVQHAIEPGHVEQIEPGAELLPTHGVTAASDGDGATRGACRQYRVTDICHRRRPQDTLHQSRIELGMDVVDEHLTVGHRRRLHRISDPPPGDDGATRPSPVVGYTWRIGLLPATWRVRPLKGLSMAEFTAEQARENLKNVFDPEIGINIVDLGLVYDVDVSDSGDVLVTMTLTSLGCPLGPVIVQEVTNAMSDLPKLGDVDVKLVWSPAWSPDMMSEDARDELGIW